LDSIKNSNDYVDGIMFAKNSGVLMLGKLTDQENFHIRKQSGWLNDWYYMHVKDIIGKNEKSDEIIPTKDYLFRYDRGAFWAAKFIFNYAHIPFNKLFRIILNPFMSARTLFRGLHVSGVGQRYLIQDYCLPVEKYEEFFNFVDKEAASYPLWVLPSSKGDRSKLSTGYIDTELVLNLGVYGESDKKSRNIIESTRLLDAKLHELGGRKVLYAQNFYSYTEFWRIYDREWYENIRKKYKAETVFENLYTKTVSIKQDKPSVAKGVLRFFLPPYRKLPVK